MILAKCPKCNAVVVDYRCPVCEPPRFDGDDYVRSRDYPRLGGQLRRIFDLMSDGQWRTLQTISQVTGDPPASVSAQLRHLRKPRFGAYQVEREHIGGGLYRYRVLMPQARSA